jgi:hypothetical protein
MWRTLFCIVLRYINISRMESLDEIMLNLQLCEKIYIYVVMAYGLLSCLYVSCVVTLLTVWRVRDECVVSFLVSCIFYAVRVEC